MSKNGKTKKNSNSKTKSDRRSERAFKITARVRETAYQTIQSVRSGMANG